MKGVILAGGRGTRLRPLTNTGPKQLIPVANKPVLQYAIEDLRDAGISEIGIILGNKGRDEVQSFFGDGSDFGVDITYIVQGDPIGIAHAVGCVADFVGSDPFVVYLGDNMLENGISELVAGFEAGEYDASIALKEVANPREFGVADIEDGQIVRTIEKPDNPPSDLAVIGVYVFSPAIFDAIDAIDLSWRGELEITDAIQELIDWDLEIGYEVIEGWWKDTGYPEDIIETNRFVLEASINNIAGRIENGAETTGTIELAETAVIESGATVRGPVCIGSDAVIKDGACIGPHTAVGDGSTVGRAHVENSVLREDVTITSEVRIVDSLIGSKTSIENPPYQDEQSISLVAGDRSNLRL